MNIIHNSNKLSIFRDENLEMTIDDITVLIAADESRTLELNKTTGELKDGMHSACVFPRYNERLTINQEY